MSTQLSLLQKSGPSVVVSSSYALLSFREQWWVPFAGCSCALRAQTRWEYIGEHHVCLVDLGYVVVVQYSSASAEKTTH